MPSAAVSFRSTASPAGATEWFAELIDREPVALSVIASVTDALLADPLRYDKPRWWAGRIGDEVVAAAMRTPPHPLHIGFATPADARALAGELARTGYEPDGVGGLREAAEAFRDEWVARTGARATTVMGLGVYDLPTRAVLRFTVPGHDRAARPDETGLVDRWMADFHREALPDAPPAQSLAPHVAAGRVMLWIVDGNPVSMAFASQAAGGVTRVSGVWTPPGFRRHGYASAVVAALSNESMDRGERCMLYTDLANPTSNEIYQQLGYRRVGDSITVRFT